MAETFKFQGRLFLTKAEAAWVFVAVPGDESDEISDRAPRGPGFGSVRVAASIGSSRWKTSLFPSKEHGAYVLPVKRSVREKEQVGAGDTVDVTIELLAI